MVDSDAKRKGGEHLKVNVTSLAFYAPNDIVVSYTKEGGSGDTVDVNLPTTKDRILDEIKKRLLYERQTSNLREELVDKSFDIQL